MNSERRSTDGFFGVASPTGSSRARPQSAGTRLRQKPAPPTHEDLFATLGIDPHADASARSSLFSNRGSNASVASASGLSNASLHQYGAPPRGAFVGHHPPPPTPALASMTNWSGGATSRFAAGPPVAAASRFGQPPTTFAAHASAVGASTATAPPPPATASSASLFSMEDADAFEMDDGWGCDSPSAVLSPTGELSSHPAADAGAASAVANDHTGFDWEVADTDRQFGITPPAPAAVAPPAALPPPLPATATASPFPFNHQPTTRGFQSGPSAAPPSSVSVSTPSASTPPIAPPPQASELAYSEHQSWDESWDDAEEVPNHKSSPVAAAHAVSGSGGSGSGSAAPTLSVPVPESLAVENEFWGDHDDDDALFADHDHATDKWDEAPAVQKTRDDLAALSLRDSEAASTDEVAGSAAGHPYDHTNDETSGSSARKSWKDKHHAPESWSSASPSPRKDAHFGNAFFQHNETVASVHFDTTGVESESAPFRSSTHESTRFSYDENPSQDEAQFYASVRRHDGSSTASLGGDVSSAGATFGGSDYVRSDTFSDGTFSETRSIFGSSNASTAFGTDFPSVSEGYSAATTTFGGSDYVSDGQYSDGNVSESPSLNGSLHPSVETNAEVPRAGEEQFHFGEDDHDGDESPFELSGNSGSTFDGAYPSAPSGGLFDQTTDASEDTNPFASSPSVSFAASAKDPGFQATPFGGASAATSTTDAASATLFGATVGSDVPNPFGDQLAPSFAAEKELEVADAGDLFASSPTAAAFGGSSSSGAFNDPPPQHYSDQSYQSYDQVQHRAPLLACLSLVVVR